MYKLLKNILFLFPPESVHHFSMNLLNAACELPLVRKQITRKFRVDDQPSDENGDVRRREIDRRVPTYLFNLKFENPVGLAAGFDKNAKYLSELKALGFGFVEIGTVTPEPQSGNKMPRLFRLPKDEALINRMGFNNDGVKVVARRLEKWRQRENKQETKLIVGGNIGKNKLTPNELAWKDYERCFKELHNWVDYFVVNVSSPNTPGLRKLQERPALQRILRHLQMINNGKAVARPILLKISPDMSFPQLDELVDLCVEIRLDGIVATNTTLDREGLKTGYRSHESGGLSGKPLKKRSTEIISRIRDRAKGELPIIGCGGIFNEEDAREKFDAGASLIQVWTGFVYEGPSIVKNICKNL